MPDLSTITPVTREEEFLDRIARAAASPNLPEVDASDNGDVLTVVSGEWAAAAPASGLPEVTASNNGQVLTVVSGEWAAAAPTGSPFVLDVHIGEKVISDATEEISYIYDADLAPLLAYERPNMIIFHIFNPLGGYIDKPVYLYEGRASDNIWKYMEDVVEDGGTYIPAVRFLEVYDDGGTPVVLFSTYPANINAASEAAHDDVNGYYYVINPA